MLAPYLQGLGLGAGLIVAIGAQNAHVLRTGLQRRHVALTVAACIAIDVLLICAGVAGMGALIERSPLLLAAARWGGVLFLAAYGARAFARALGRSSMAVSRAREMPSATAALGAVLAVSLLHPHVYLDTVVLLGAVGGQQPEGGGRWFAAGAATASTLWFLSLGFGARLLAPWFARPAAWRALDAGIGVVMLVLAGLLALSPLRAG